jgi:hypothetical protein
MVQFRAKVQQRVIQDTWNMAKYNICDFYNILYIVLGYNYILI